MKKLYSLLFSALFTASLFAADGPTFTVLNLKAPTGDEGVVHTETKYNAGIEIKFRNVTSKVWPGIFFPSCLEDAQFDAPYVEMVNTNTVASNANDHSYLEIKNTGEAIIERVEFVAGAAAKAAKLVCGASIDGVDYMSNYVIAVSEKSVYKSMTFSAPVAGDMVVCGANSFYEVPEHIIYDTFLGGSGPDYPEFRKEVKYIRLNWSSQNFAGSAGAKGDPVNLFAIKIYTNADTTGTGISEEKENSLIINVQNAKLDLSENADVKIYSLQGNLEVNESNIESLDLSHLAKGIYIVKAYSMDKKQTVVKKIIL